MASCDVKLYPEASAAASQPQPHPWSALCCANIDVYVFIKKCPSCEPCTSAFSSVLQAQLSLVAAASLTPTACLSDAAQSPLWMGSAKRGTCHSSDRMAAARSSADAVKGSLQSPFRVIPHPTPGDPPLFQARKALAWPSTRFLTTTYGSTKSSPYQQLARSEQRP